MGFNKLLKLRLYQIPCAEAVVCLALAFSLVASAVHAQDVTSINMPKPSGSADSLGSLGQPLDLGGKDGSFRALGEDDVMPTGTFEGIAPVGNIPLDSINDTTATFRNLSVDSASSGGIGIAPGVPSVLGVVTPRRTTRSGSF